MIYDHVLQIWYDFENLLFILLGSGFGPQTSLIGTLPHNISGRPHSIILEFFIISGTLLGIIYLIYIYIFLKQFKDYRLLIYPVIFPFYALSLTSFNVCILIFFQFLLITQLTNYNKIK